jgi:hypothetical protein
MKHPISLVLVLLVAACSADGPTATAPLLEADDVQLASTMGASVVASVTGHAEHTFASGALYRRASFSARLHADGGLDGRFQVVLNGPAHLTGGYEDGVRAITFQVTCMEVEGNRAWIGARIVAPTTDRWHGYEDVWFLEDGGKDGPDRVVPYIGAPAHLCSVRPVPQSNPEWVRGQLTIRDNQ